MTTPITIPPGGMQREPVQTVQRVTPPIRPPVAPVTAAEDSSLLSALTREDSLVAEANDKLKLASIGVQFELDRETDTMVARVVDVETGELIRQIPSEELLQLSKTLGKFHDLLAHQAICRKAQLADEARAPAPARWSNSWAAALSPESSTFRPVKV